MFPDLARLRSEALGRMTLAHNMEAVMGKPLEVAQTAAVRTSGSPANRASKRERCSAWARSTSAVQKANRWSGAVIRLGVLACGGSCGEARSVNASSFPPRAALTNSASERTSGRRLLCKVASG